jgi:alcohol dehydrogenase
MKSFHLSKEKRVRASARRIPTFELAASVESIPMRQLTFIKPGLLEWQDVPVPRLEADTDALVRPLAVARCDLDLYIANGVAAGYRGPFAMGHEAVGFVTDAGPKAGVAPGVLVVVPFQLSCGRCANCKRGWTNSCSNVPHRAAFGMKPLSGVEHGGALSELMRVPYADHMLVPVPAGVEPLAIASIADNIPDGWRAVAPHLNERPGANVLVVGGMGKSIGLYAAGAAASLGAGKVLYLDDDEERRRIAMALGASAEPLALGERRPVEQFEITVDASGNMDALNFAVVSTAPNGVITVVSLYFTDAVPFPMRRMYGKGIALHTGRVQARMELPGVIAHCAAGHFHPEKVTSRIVPFSDAADAMTDPGAKIVFRNDWS